jgi:formaldehyde-activating enzyme involved in methanogenesis
MVIGQPNIPVKPMTLYVNVGKIFFDHTLLAKCHLFLNTPK